MATIFTESFETDGNGTRYMTSISEFSDGSGDFFTRTDGSNISSSYEVAGADGSFYFTAQDIDGEGADSQQTLTFSGIDVSGSNNLGFEALFAEDDSSDGNEDWDDSDFVTIEYQLDGGGFNNLLAFENDGSQFNSPPLQDTDFDGTGDGTEVTATFATFSSAIAQTGSSLDLRFTFNLDSGDEDIAVDAITITDDGDGGGGDMNPPNIFINEVDADTPGSDSAEFVELFDGGAGNTSLDGLVAVFYNGSNDSSYAAFDLDGFSTDSNGFFVLGNEGVANVGLTFNNNGLQNGADAVAIYQGDTADFPNGTAVTSENLIDAIVYGTNDSDDSGLLTGLGQNTQFDEDADNSNSRVPDGMGDFIAQAPTPGATNSVDNGGGGDEITLISEIQGSGDASPIEGQEVTIEAVVVGDFQDGDSTDEQLNGDLNGFFVQEQDSDADGDAATSEGLFIFDGDSPAVDVNEGDVVQITGTVTEFNGLTELTDVSVSVSGTDSLPTPATVNFPLDAVSNLEAFEGMQITIPDTLFVTEYFNLDRFGEVVLSSDGESNQPETDGRLDQYTQFNDPDAAGFAAYQEAIDNRRIVLDDGQTVQNPDPIIHGRGGQPLSADNTLRGGDTVNNLSGVLSFGFGDYRIQPVEPVDFQATNLRPEGPEDVGGDLKVASFNVLNFFTTLDVEGNPGSGPNNLEPRGADNQAEFDRQIEKLVTTIVDLDADVVGLVELENEFNGDQNGDGQFAIDTFVNALNDREGAGTYAYVEPGVPFVDTGDAISVGAIYKTDSVRVAEGTTVEVLTDSDLDGLGLDFNQPVFDGPSTNRAPLAVTFEEIATGEDFTVAVNHFKSKGGDGSGDDADTGDGQGNFNGTRVRGSQALNAWLQSDPTGSGDEDFLILGDLNAYAQEDPITFLEDNGYTDLVQEFVGNDAYSFVFDGQFGTLDYGLANESLLEQVTGATEWHVNADEPDALDYNLDFGRDPELFDGSEPFRNSDHDIAIFGLDLAGEDEPEVNTIEGTRRDDNIRGTSGNDLITGKNGKDTIDGGAGNDTIDGGRAKDFLIGGNGEDSLIGGAAKDTLDGGRGKDFLSGGNGKDSLIGGNGNDTLLGEVNQDTLEGGNGNDSLDGGGGKDLLFGGDGVDTLIGGAANDTLIGGGNNDNLEGGRGRDTFVLASGEGTDTIIDFELNRDSLELSGGLSFGQLSLEGDKINFNDETLAVLTGIDTSSLDEGDFDSM